MLTIPSFRSQVQDKLNQNLISYSRLHASLAVYLAASRLKCVKACMKLVQCNSELIVKIH